MDKMKNYKNFIKYNLREKVENEIDDQIQTDYEIETEEDDILELKYDKNAEEWEVQGELDNPDDFEDFYEWFEELDEDNILASMKEDDDEVVFYIPEDIYIEYLEDSKDDEFDFDEDDDEDEDFDD